MASAPVSLPTPRFPRARPADAIDLAIETLLAEARVDMQTLAAQLGVAPATLYRWFGSRGVLLEQAFELLARRFSAEARAEAEGDGDERVCAYARNVMSASAAFQPLRSFVEREKELGLRLLLRREGAVHRVISDELLAVVSETRPAAQAQQLDEAAHVIVQIATSLVWATFMVGDEPQIDEAVQVIRVILASTRPAGASPA
jgi:AcrR family transcriptional regulator